MNVTHRSGFRWNGVSVSIVIITILIAMAALLNRRDQVAGFNQEIQYDDFAFSVLSARKTDTLGIGANRKTAWGHYYIVTMKVANHALRVSYRFQNAIIRLVDEKGREYHVSSDGQRTLDTARGIVASRVVEIAHGDTYTTDLVFELPADTQPSYLRVSMGGPVGDILNSLFWGSKIIKLS